MPVDRQCEFRKRFDSIVTLYGTLNICSHRKSYFNNESFEKVCCSHFDKVEVTILGVKT